MNQMQSETVTKVLGALLAARKEYGSVKKNAHNEFTKKPYADLSSVKEAIDEALLNAGIIVLDQLDTEGATAIVTTRAIHAESGEWVGSKFAGEAKGQNVAQEVGKLYTYGRRYNRLGLFDLAAEDDDAEGGPKRQRQENKPQSKPRQAAKPAPHAILDAPCVDGDERSLAKWTSDMVKVLGSMPSQHTIAQATTIQGFLDGHHEANPADERIKKALTALGEAIDAATTAVANQDHANMDREAQERAA